MTTWPMPLSPSTSAMPAASRSTRTRGCAFTAPPRRRRTYCGRRNTPWPSAPKRSARTIRRAQMSASCAGRPTFSRTAEVNDCRRFAGTRRASVAAWGLEGIRAGFYRFGYHAAVTANLHPGLKVGLAGSAELVVGEEHTAPRVGSGRVRVLATPVMINLIEAAALAAIEHLLAP